MTIDEFHRLAGVMFPGLIRHG